MQKFKNDSRYSFLSFLVVSIAYLIMFLPILFLFDINISHVPFLAWPGAAALYLTIGYLYNGMVNNDVILLDDRIEIKNDYLFFKKHKIFFLKDIKAITLKHEWNETIGKSFQSKRTRNFIKEISLWFFPYDYKWINIETDRPYRFYCFGIEMDFYDNLGPTFEELFYALSELDINVSWTDTSESYYASMAESAKQKRLKKSMVS